MTDRKDKSADSIQRSAARMKHARSAPRVSPLRGLGVFGIIGWSVAVPTVGGAFLGLWLNRVAPQTFSWPIALILGGATVGVVIAWNWVSREATDHNEQIRQQPDNKDDR